MAVSLSVSINERRAALFKKGEGFKDMWEVERMIVLYPERHAAVIWVAENHKEFKGN